jgi:RNA polymerase sigma-70 factor (ECF subfamily)
MSSLPGRNAPNPEDFATTQWNLVMAAGQQSSPDSRSALESLCQTYWYPLYAYVRRRVQDSSEAQDLTQAFFSQLLEKNYVGQAAPDRGRFRAFLLTAFKNFLSKQWEKDKAQKRGGGRAPISLDFETGDSRYRIEPATNLTAEQLYEKQWALTLLDRIMKRLEEELADAGQSDRFGVLKEFLVGDHAGLTYAGAAAELNTTEAAAKMAAHRLRRRYRELLRDEIAQTVSSPEEVDEEIRELFAVLAR